MYLQGVLKVEEWKSSAAANWPFSETYTDEFILIFH